MYHPFFQFVLPRLGQVALDALLYLNFLQLRPYSWWPGGRCCITDCRLC